MAIWRRRFCYQNELEFDSTAPEQQNSKLGYTFTRNIIRNSEPIYVFESDWKINAYPRRSTIISYLIQILKILIFFPENKNLSIFKWGKNCCTPARKRSVIDGNFFVKVSTILSNLIIFIDYYKIDSTSPFHIEACWIFQIVHEMKILYLI